MHGQGRRALIRMGGTPLVENRSLPFTPPPLSCHPSVKMGGGSDGRLRYSINLVATVFVNGLKRLCWSAPIEGREKADTYFFKKSGGN